MSRLSIIIIWLFIIGLNLIKAQPASPVKNPDLLRGPQNTLQGGVVDGVVVKDELPVRSRVEYEYVRLADYAWSKRIFSRIDAREKINHGLFNPYDAFNQFDYKFPRNLTDVDQDRNWLKHQDRLSLWTIIERHIFLGDLTVYQPFSEQNGLIEDGYQLKYPIISYDPNLGPEDWFFKDNKYRDEVSKFLSVGSKKSTYSLDDPNDPTGATKIPLERRCISFQRWIDSLTDASSTSLVTMNGNANPPATIYDALLDLIGTPKGRKELEDAWIAAKDTGAYLLRDAQVRYISSRSISAYNIKEDWFFDKERSMLDKRIICIAPVVKLKSIIPKPGAPLEPLVRYENVLLVNDENGSLETLEVDSKGQVSSEPFVASIDFDLVERELFWLYFPQLRNVMVNYYVYNTQSDAQWMSFDDYFWKRMFSATIYRSSDQFDRDVEDYRYGVDALYEAEKIKETMRTWETDLWNY